MDPKELLIIADIYFICILRMIQVISCSYLSLTATLLIIDKLGKKD